jgi:hypothetical protein
LLLVGLSHLVEKSQEAYCALMPPRHCPIEPEQIPSWMSASWPMVGWLRGELNQVFACCCRHGDSLTKEIAPLAPDSMFNGILPGTLSPTPPPLALRPRPRPVHAKPRSKIATRTKIRGGPLVRTATWYQSAQAPTDHGYFVAARLTLLTYLRPQPTSPPCPIPHFSSPSLQATFSHQWQPILSLARSQTTPLFLCSVPRPKASRALHTSQHLFLIMSERTPCFVAVVG